MTIAVCMKLVARRVDIDPLDATVDPDPRSWGPSPADEAALEVALQIAEARADEVLVVSAAPAEAEPMLRDALTRGANHATRIELAQTADSAAVAAVLAELVAEAALVLCGDHSLDRGSGSVPAMIAARLAVGQALGCVAVTVAADALTAVRRTDRGGREILRVGGPAVVSVEASVARLRRAAIPAMLDVGLAPIAAVVPDRVASNQCVTTATRPYRPRPQYVAAPTPSAGPLRRILDLTDAMTERTPPRLLELEPDAAADAIVAQLAEWGYLDDDGGPTRTGDIP